MNEKLCKKIDFLTEITCYDHYKDKDMLYTIECEYRAFDGVKYYPFHNGYIWHYPEYSETVRYNTYEEAEKKLEEAVDEKIKLGLEWLWDYVNNKEKYDVWGSPVKTEKDWIKLRDRYYELK